MGLGTVIRAAAAAWAFPSPPSPPWPTSSSAGRPFPPPGAHGNLRAGAQLYFDAVNAAGGVPDHKLRLVSRDDSYKAAETVRLVQAIIKPSPSSVWVGTGNIEACSGSRPRRIGHPLVAFRSSSSNVAGAAATLAILDPRHLRRRNRQNPAAIRSPRLPAGGGALPGRRLRPGRPGGGQRPSPAKRRRTGGQAAYEKYDQRSGAVKAIYRRQPRPRADGLCRRQRQFVRQFQATGQIGPTRQPEMTTDAQQVVDKIGSRSSPWLAITPGGAGTAGIPVPLVKGRFTWGVQNGPRPGYRLQPHADRGVSGGWCWSRRSAAPVPAPGRQSSGRRWRDWWDYDAGGVVIGFSPNQPPAPATSISPSSTARALVR